jgi:hypothetical protein
MVEGVMTAPATQAPPTAAEIERATALATRLLKGRWRGKQLAAVAAAIGRALTVTAPGSEHGQLLARALRPAVAERPDDECSVFWLAKRGETPTAPAVAAALQGLAERRVRTERHHALAAQFVAADGPRAAAYVADVVGSTGTGPTWGALTRAMGWPWSVANLVIKQLAQAGWLRTGEEPCSLRPGPAAHQRETPRDLTAPGEGQP